MRTGDLFFIGIVITLILVGAIAALGTQQPAPVDSFNHAPGTGTNSSAGLIANTTAGESAGLGMGLVLVSVALIVSIVLGIMAILRKRGIFGNSKYRT
jgi:hypothetical protein